MMAQMAMKLLLDLIGRSLLRDDSLISKDGIGTVTTVLYWKYVTFRM